MVDRKFLVRIDRHMELGNELMREVRDEMRLSREEREQSRMAYAQLQGDLRTFTRDLILRVDRFMREHSTVMREHSAVIREQSAELRDLREESRAQTRALLRVLDRLEPGGGTSSV